MRIKLILLFCCLYSLRLSAQIGYSVKGAVADTDSRIKLSQAGISVLNLKDSILVNYAFSIEDGSFIVANLPAGNFLLLISYPEYADYVEPFMLDAQHPLHDFGNLNLRLKTKLLQEVMIKGQVRAIKIKGDTTEFNAKAYSIQPNDKVEDLLKQLPGIQIDKDGKITANGETVNKVLVDGEEFFGDDPTLVTKNIRADMVDKVQLYDKKSDQAAFTGIDDGQKTKTLNIKLKDDKKNGAFGRLSGGIGNEDYYETQDFYNRFNGKNKFSAYATIANDGKTGLGFADNGKLGTSGSNVQVGDDGSVRIFTGSGGDDLDSFNGTYSGKGLPLARSGGLHYDGKSADNKQAINLNYKIGSMQLDGVTTTQTQQSLPNSVLNTNSSQTFHNYAFRQKFDATDQIKMDTSTTLKLSADGTIKTFKVNNIYQSVTDNNDTLVNRSNRNVINNGTEYIFNASAFFTKKFKKPRRTFSWNVSEAYDKNETQGYLLSEVDYFNKLGVQDSVQKINQYKTINTVSSALNSNMTFTEPLSKTFAIVFNYGLAVNNSTSDRKSFDQFAPGVYTILNKAYSNDYLFNQLTNQAGAIFNYKQGKTTFNFGTKASDVDFKQTDEISQTVYKRDFINWLPQSNFQYKFSQQRSLSISYNGSTVQPTIQQIQPILVNTDPLNITLGNAGLRPSFKNAFSFGYSSYQVLSNTSFSVNGNYFATTNAIVNNTTTDFTTGKTTIQYVNLASRTPENYFLYTFLNTYVKPLEMYVGFNTNSNVNISYSYINGLLDKSVTASYSAQFLLQKIVPKKYDFLIFAGPVYTVNEFSLQPQNKNNAPGLIVNGSGDLYLPLKFIIAPSISYNYTAKTQSLDANQRTIMNVTLGKTFFKDDNLKLSLAANNLFNQDVNFSRSITANTLMQTTSTSIRRFFMFSVSWDFTYFPSSKS